MNIYFLVEGIGISLGGFGLILNYVATKNTVKYLKNKNAFNINTAVSLEELGLSKYNWIIFFENRLSVLRRTNEKKYYLDEHNLKTQSSKIRLQLIFGTVSLLIGLFFIAYSIYFDL